MKVTISQSDLLNSLKIVSRAVANANSLPVLSNILIRAEGKKLHFAATNLEISIVTACAAEIKNEGSITVPARIFASYVSNLTGDGDIDLSVGDGSTLEIISKDSTSDSKIKTLPADDFPDIPKVASKVTAEISCEHLRQGIAEVAFSSQENSSRPILSGVFCCIKKDNICLAATNSYRLSEKKIPGVVADQEMTCVVPVRAVMEVDRLASLTKDKNIKIAASDNQIMFQVGQASLTSRLIEGQFPDYKQIIPTTVQTTVTVDRAVLELAVRKVSIFAKENNFHMKLECLSDGTMIVATDATQIGQGKAVIPIKINGSNNIIALNSDYVLDILVALSDEKQINIELNEKLSPAVFRKLKGDDFLHLIMPLKM